MHYIFEIMTPSRFLTIGGTTLIVLGGAGVLGILRRISAASLFNPPARINWVHLGGGIIVSAIAVSGSSPLQRRITVLAAIVGTVLGSLGLLFGRFAARRFGIAQLADPSDHLAHLSVGLAAAWACMN